MFDIRLMLDTDLAEVACIEQQNLSPWSIGVISEELRQERQIVLVAELDNTRVKGQSVVGWCACRYLAPEAELMKIAVREDARNQGVASCLLKFLCKLLSERSVKTLLLEVRSQNQSALRFYEKESFLQTGERAGYYSNPVDSALLFQKTL